jgi:hypothetical protein
MVGGVTLTHEDAAAFSMAAFETMYLQMVRDGILDFEDPDERLQAELRPQ